MTLPEGVDIGDFFVSCSFVSAALAIQGDQDKEMFDRRKFKYTHVLTSRTVDLSILKDSIGLIQDL